MNKFLFCGTFLVALFLVSCNSPSPASGGETKAPSGIEKKDSAIKKEVSVDSLLLPLKDNVACLYGFTNRKGEWVIQPSFTSVFPFYHGRCIVCNANNYGVIDYEGKFVVPMHQFEFDWFTDFKNGYAVIESGDQKGIFSQEGKMILEPKYPMIYFIRNTVLMKMQIDLEDTLNEMDLEPGIFRFWNKKGKVGLLDSTGKEALAADYDRIGDISDGLAYTFKENKEGLIDRRGKIFLAAEYDKISSYMGSVFDYEVKGKKGICSRSGKITDAIYEDVRVWGESSYYPVKKNGKWGLVNNAGKVELDFKFDMVDTWRMNNVFFTLDKKTGILNLKTGKILVPAQFDEAYGMSGAAGNAFAKKNGKWGVIDSSFKTLLPFEYDAHFYDTGNRMYFVKGNRAEIYDKDLMKLNPPDLCTEKTDVIIVKSYGSDKDALIRKDGVVLLKPDFKIDYAESLGYIMFSDSKGRAGIFDKYGNELKAFSKFSAIVGATGDYYYVQSKTGKQGIADLKGKLILDTIYWAVTAYNEEEDCIWVVPEHPPIKSKTEYSTEYDLDKVKFALVNKRGKKLLPAEFDVQSPFDGGRALTAKNGKWGVIEKTGKVIIPFDYQMIWWFDEGFVIQKNDKYGFAGSDGKILLQPEYKYIGGFIKGYARIENESGEGLIDKQGKFAVPIGKEALVYAKKDLIELMELETKARGYDFSEIDLLQDINLKRLIRNYCYAFNSQAIPLHQGYNEPNFGDYDFFYEGSLFMEEWQRNQMNSMGSEEKRESAVDWCAGKMFSVMLHEQYYDNDEVNNTEHLMFEMQKGKLVKITLDSIFESKSNYPQGINQMLLNKIRYNKGLNFECANPAAVFESVRESFSLSKKGITFFIQGEDFDKLEVFFTFAELKKYLRKGGPVSRLLSSK